MINENIAYSKSILNKKGIDKDTEEYKDYLKIREICGRNHGYVGILTKIRFIDELSDMDEIQSIFDVLSNSKIDINKLNKLSYDEILEIFYNELTSKVDNSDIELYYKDDQYSYYKVYTYKGILRIGSPAWCLKTKANWDNYQAKYPEQWVVIDNRYKKNLLSPDTNYMGNYSNKSKTWVRYGISIKSNSDDTITWTANDDNNGRVRFDPESWTFFGVMNTVMNLSNGVKKSYYDYFLGCEKYNNNWLKIKNKGTFLNRFNQSSDLLKYDDESYVMFSKSYSYLPIILSLSNTDIKIRFLTDNKTEEFFNKPVVINNKKVKELILDYAKRMDDVLFDGIKVHNNLMTLEDVEKRKQFVKKIDNWLIFNRNKNFYLIVNLDIESGIEVTSISKNGVNNDMKNPFAWYLDKKTMRPYDSKIKDIQKPVIEYLKSSNGDEEDNKEDRKVKGFWSFLKNKK